MKTAKERIVALMGLDPAARETLRQAHGVVCDVAHMLKDEYETSVSSGDALYRGVIEALLCDGRTSAVLDFVELVHGEWFFDETDGEAPLERVGAQRV